MEHVSVGNKDRRGEGKCKEGVSTAIQNTNIKQQSSISYDKTRKVRSKRTHLDCETRRPGDEASGSGGKDCRGESEGGELHVCRLFKSMRNLLSSISCHCHRFEGNFVAQ